MSSSPTATQSYHMFVRDLVLTCLIGVYAHERTTPQRVRINVDMNVLAQPGPLPDDFSQVMSYEDVIEGIKNLLAGGHINLVETLAEKIAAICLSDRRVVMAKVRVEKLDVYTEAAAVGIEIERQRP